MSAGRTWPTATAPAAAAGRQPLLVYDIGMYDGADTEYYLESGYSVVAVEANPHLVELANEKFSEFIRSSRLQLVNAAISEDGNPVELTIAGDDLGSSSVHAATAARRSKPLGKIPVQGATLRDLFRSHGLPHYLKVDIEGADGLCVRALSRDTRPAFLSFEIGEDFEELLDHAAAVGYSKFKIINQTNFLELSNDHGLVERLSRKLIRLVGYAEPNCVRRSGRFFDIGHSSGPVPWESDGRWSSRSDVTRKWRCAKAQQGRNVRNVWYDCHAT